MTQFIHKYFHPLSGKLIFWNLLLLVFIKLVFSQSAFQLASIVGSLPVFDSREIIRLTNDTRSANNLPPLNPNSKLDLAAEQKLDDMAMKEYFAHVSPEGTTPWFWIRQAQYKYRVAGENLAIGFTTSDDTIRAWLDSPSHKANLLNSQYQDIGVAVKGVEINGSQGLLVVQMFGSPSAQNAGTVNATPLPSKTPSPTPINSTVSPVPSSVAVGGAQIREEPIVLNKELVTIQHVSTDMEIPTVNAPKVVEFEDAKTIENLSSTVNNVFAGYTLALTVLSIFAFFILNRSRGMALKMALHAAVFILTVLIPVSGLSFEGLIF